MGHKKKVRNIIILCLISIITSLVLALPEVFGLCSSGDDKCMYWYIDTFDNLVQTILYFAFAIGVVSIWMYFLNEKVFNIWKNFAGIYLLIAFILIFLSPTTNMQFVGFDKELTTMWTAGIFFVVSIIIILIKKQKHSILDLDEC